MDLQPPQGLIPLHKDFEELLSFCPRNTYSTLVFLQLQMANMIKIFILLPFLLTSAFAERTLIECPETDVLYGNTGAYFWYVPNVETWEDCGRICALVPNCNYWSWSEEENENHNNCIFYETAAGLEFNTAYISGERGCPEDPVCKGDI